VFTFEQIKELIDLVAKNRLHGLTVERSGFMLRIEGGPSPAAREAAPATAAAAPASASPAVGSAAAPAAATPAAGTGLHVLPSPIVGTYYSAPSPDAAPFVRVGDRVRKGQVLCIVEAMKLMNEIESDADGTVAEIYPKNAQPVEFGEALFGIRVG